MLIFGPQRRVTEYTCTAKASSCPLREPETIQVSDQPTVIWQNASVPSHRLCEFISSLLFLASVNEFSLSIDQYWLVYKP